MSLTRRQLIWLAAIGSAGLPVAAQAATPSRNGPRPDDDPPAPPDPVGVLGTKSDPETMTIEAWSDTLIPGRKRFPGDVAIAGVARGAGAVQAGAVRFMRFGPTGVAPALPAFVAALDGEATSYIAAHHRTVDPTLPPFVALGYPDRKALVASLTNTTGDQQLLWFAFAGLAFLAYHTAGYLNTAKAVRDGHPGLKAIGFPMPDHDDLWRFPTFSYRRRLAHSHPATTPAGQPA